MNSMELTASWLQSLGWTLIHSLWQVPLLLVLTASLQRAIANKNSNARYLIGVSSLVLVLLASAITFLLVSTRGQSVAPVSPGTSVLLFFSPDSNAIPSAIEPIVSWIDSQLSWVIRFWLLGFTFFALRLTAGFWHLQRLRNQSTVLHGNWHERVNELAAQLGISRAVALAEGCIDAPLVIGLLKPLILFPAGLLAGLAPQQIEAILLHELTHIKRQDFLVNLFQAVMEAIYFFNPFVWILSDSISRDREHCCDDMVLAKGFAPQVYANTLAQLEEARLAIPLSLALTGRKNHLLNRIKRIMEHSVKRDSGRPRFFPIVLILAGLLLTSWLSVNREGLARPKKEARVEQPVIPSDTTRKKAKPTSSTYERRTVTRWDEKGVPHEETSESYDGDMEAADAWDGPELIAPFDFPEFPDFPPLVDPMDGFSGMLHFPGLNFDSDSLPTRRFNPSFDEDEWAAFEEEFEARMKENFTDFFEKNQGKFKKILEEAREKSKQFERSDWDIDLTEKFRRMEDEFASMRPPLREFPPMADLERMEEDLERHQKDLRNHDREMQRWKQEMEKQEQEMKVWESRSKQFEKVVKDQLIQDGYLGKNETLDGLSFHDDGSMEINGRSIKEKDRSKYRDLHRKYFQKGDSFPHQE